MRGEDLLPFTEPTTQYECPVCGHYTGFGWAGGWFMRKRFKYCRCLDYLEDHLHLWCMVCGYDWGMELKPRELKIDYQARFIERERRKDMDARINK